MKLVCQMLLTDYGQIFIIYGVVVLLASLLFPAELLLEGRKRKKRRRNMVTRITRQD